MKWFVENLEACKREETSLFELFRNFTTSITTLPCVFFAEDLWTAGGSCLGYDP